MQESFEKLNINLNLAAVSGCLPILKKNGKAQSREVIDFILLDYLPKNAGKIEGVIICANWINSKDDKFTLVQNIKETVNYLHKMGLKTIIIGQNETYNIAFTSIAAREYQYNTEISANYLNDESYDWNLFLRENLQPFYLDVYNLNSFLKLSPEHTPYMMDQNHFTKTGADLVIRQIFADKKFLNFLRGY